MHSQHVDSQYTRRQHVLTDSGEAETGYALILYTEKKKKKKRYRNHH